MVDFRPDLLSKDAVVGALTKMLPQEDIADMVVDDLRKWQCWDVTDKVLKLAELKSHDTTIIHRAILRFALQSHVKNKKAAEYVAAQRKADPDMVRDVEELLQLELAPKPVTPSSAARPNASETASKSGPR
jgi:hypothetical protein